MEYKYLIDTGVLSRYYLNEIKLPKELLFFGCISVVTKIELYNWLSNCRMDAVKRRQTLKSIQNLKVIHFTEKISKLVESYADKNLHIKASDTIIGVTALYHDLELHTGDKNDFDVFKGIRKKYYPQKKNTKN